MTRTTSGYAARAIDELPTLSDGFATLVGAGLDITAFGANILDLPPTTRRARTTRPRPASRSSTWPSGAPARS